eukprot:4535353-Pleurochrysis_carterae.AAC.1
MEGSTRGGEVCGLLTSYVRFVLFVVLGGENFPVRRPCGATREPVRGWSREREGRGSGRGPRAPLAVPALYDAAA